MPTERRIPAILVFATALLTPLLVAACGTPAPPPEPSAAPLVDWNERVLAMAEEEDGFLTLKGVRTAAMMHLAVHDALNAVDRRYQPYAYDGEAPNADPRAAAAEAAYVVVVSQFPDHQAELAAARGEWLAAADDEAAVAAGREVGRAAAEAILETRQDDRWDGEAEYVWHPMGPGVYAEFAEHSGTPEGFVFGAGWATAEPFLLESADHFRSPPPPAIDGAAYTAAFDEVKEVGAAESATRTADQTHLALWWKDFAENSHSRLARRLVREDDPGLWRAARTFALLEMTIYDAYVNVFDNKFHYNHWRPYTAIRWAANDGNPATAPDEDWNNTHGHTYAFPSYPSAHGTACAAAMTVLADAFGDERPFTMTTNEVDVAGPFSGKMEMDPPTRSFYSFEEACMECAMSRLYLGIHFRYDSTAGNALGKQIGEYAVENYLRPVAGS